MRASWLGYAKGRARTRSSSWECARARETALGKELCGQCQSNQPRAKNITTQENEERRQGGGRTALSSLGAIYHLDKSVLGEAHIGRIQAQHSFDAHRRQSEISTGKV